MEIKKSKKADLERNLGLFFQIGLITGLLLVLFAFEWTTPPEAEDHFSFISETSYDIEETIFTERKEPKTEPVIREKLVDVMILVDDDVIIDDQGNFDPEADQNTKFDITIITDEVDELIKDERFIVVEDMPLFNGGDPAVEFRKYISDKMKYPTIAAENGIKGRVIVEFVVDAQGRVTDAVVVSSVDPALDREALRVVLSSPLWTPGKQRGKPVKVLYYFPINFVLNNN